MTNDADRGPRSSLEELAAAAGPPVEVIGVDVLRTAALVPDELAGIEAHLRDTARELLAARLRIAELEAENESARTLVAKFVAKLGVHFLDEGPPKDLRVRLGRGHGLVRVSWRNASNGLGTVDLIRHLRARLEVGS